MQGQALQSRDAGNQVPRQVDRRGAGDDGGRGGAVFQRRRRASTTGCSILQQVGLGYIALGQQATTLSGGEAQRIKLSKELARRATGRTLYILDEPTTGLHFEDVRKLLEVLHALVDQGNTVVVIEHNLEVIKTADWILDLGPEGGDGGGRIVAQGTPEDIVADPESYTGRFLAPLLQVRCDRSGRGAAPNRCQELDNASSTTTKTAIQHLLAPQHDAEVARNRRPQPPDHGVASAARPAPSPA